MYLFNDLIFFAFLITIHFLHVFSKTELNPQNTSNFTEQQKKTLTNFKDDLFK